MAGGLEPQVDEGPDPAAGARVSGSRAVVASDLDRTLIWSAGAAGGAGEIGDALCVEEYDGAPLSYVGRAAAADVAVLLGAGLLVPVTTRTVDQYRRVRLPGGPARYAVCANGGRVLVDGVDDEEHRARVRRAVGGGASLEEVARVFATWCAASAGATGGGGPRLREAEGLFCYAVYPQRAPGPAEVAELTALLETCDWGVSVQGRKVYCVPRALSKEAALASLAEAHDLRIVATAGDSLLDAGMVAAFGTGWVPRGSELERRGWSAPGVVVTAGVGLDAGREVLRGFRELLGC